MPPILLHVSLDCEVAETFAEDKKSCVSYMAEIEH